MYSYNKEDQLERKPHMGNIWSSGVKRNGIKWSGGQGKKEQPGNQDRNTCSCLSTIKEVKTMDLDNKLDLGIQME